MRSSILLATALAAAGCGLVGCSEKVAVPATELSAAAAASSRAAALPPPDTGNAPGVQHHVDLMPGQGADVAGGLDLVASNGEVAMTGTVTGLKPRSVHGFHIHQKGDCSSADFKSAGDHFNPTTQMHGNPATSPHHLGDVPNLQADAEGKASVNTLIDGVTLGDRGPDDLVGRAVVVHADADDYTTQPSGNSGDRIACGVIR